MVAWILCFLLTPSALLPLPTPQRPRTDLLGDPLPPRALARMGSMRWLPPQKITALAFAPDGQRLALVSEDGSIRLWEIATQRPDPINLDRGRPDIFTPARLVSLAFSPDGKLLAAGGGGMAHIWNAATGAEVRKIWGASEEIYVAFSPDSKVLAATIGPNRRVALINMSDGAVRGMLDGSHGRTLALAFSPDGKYLACGGQDQAVHLWQVASQRYLASSSAFYDPVRWLAFTHDGKQLVAASRGPLAARNESIRLLDAMTLEAGPPLRGTSRAQAVCLTPDGKSFVAGFEDGSLGFWDLAQRRMVDVMQGPMDGLTAMAISPDGKLLACTERPNYISLRDVASNRPLHAPLRDVTSNRPLQGNSGHRGSVQDLALLANDRVLVTVGADETMRWWDSARGSERQQIRSDKVGSRLLASPDRRLLATGGMNEASLWDATTGQFLRQFKAQGKPLSFTASGQELIVADDQIRFVDTATGKVVRNLASPGTEFHWSDRQVVSSTGRFFARWHPERWNSLAEKPCEATLFLSDTTTQQVRAVQRKELALFTTGSITFSPQGSLLAVLEQIMLGSSRRAVLELLDPISGRSLRTWDYPLVPEPDLKRLPLNLALAFSPDGRVLASGDNQGTIYLWEVATGRERLRFQGHRGLVTCLAFTSDNRRLISGSADATCLVWDFPGQIQMPQTDRASLDSLWERLGSARSQDAFQALCAFSALGDRGVAYLQQVLQPAVPADRQRLEKLASKLSAQDSSERSDAMAALRRDAGPVEPILQKLCERNPALEVLERTASILESRRRWMSAERLQVLYAVEVLERQGSRKAEALLTALAKGDAEALLTQEAKAALERLGARKARALTAWFTAR